MAVRIGGGKLFVLLFPEIGILQGQATAKESRFRKEVWQSFGKSENRVCWYALLFLTQHSQCTFRMVVTATLPSDFCHTRLQSAILRGLNGDFYRRVPLFFSDAHAALRLHPSPFSKQKSNGPIPPGDDADGTEQALKCSDVKTGCASWHFFDGAERFCSAISLRGHVALNGFTADVQQEFSAISERVHR